MSGFQDYEIVTKMGDGRSATINGWFSTFDNPDEWKRYLKAITDGLAAAGFETSTFLTSKVREEL